MQKKRFNINAIVCFILALEFLGAGIYMLINNLVAYGVRSRTLSLYGFGGSLLILVSIVFFYVAYHSLSPFGKIRTFLEDSNKMPRRRKTNHIKKRIQTKE
ncbi:hypothetical protein [Pontibacter beigongshangensis]|uniref:hypothetical protein n=1 Tax=Pontibacter beigongshangensis TaxID=2574733 RepID=UPI00164F01E2|nr:hypothetical protein [Pontibacter beigongshangensis]